MIVCLHSGYPEHPRNLPNRPWRAIIGFPHRGQGISVVVFPQATRMVEFDAAGFNTLAEKLAGRAGVPVVPLALRTDFFRPGRWVRDMGPVDPARPVHVRFGPAVATDARGHGSHEALVGFITACLREDDRVIWFRVESENEESIHTHNAYALIEEERA